MLKHEDSRHSLDWLGSLGSLDSSKDRGEVVVEVVVAVDDVDCSAVNTADSSKEMAVVVVVGKPDRVVRSRGRSGMGSNIAWHRRHNDSVD